MFSRSSDSLKRNLFCSVGVCEVIWRKCGEKNVKMQFSEYFFLPWRHGLHSEIESWVVRSNPAMVHKYVQGGSFLKINSTVF
jgi:hypothetical protein